MKLAEFFFAAKVLDTHEFRRVCALELYVSKALKPNPHEFRRICVLELHFFKV